MKITAELLRKNGACSEQVKLFRKVFPKGANVTKENIQKAISSDLYVYWLESIIPKDRQSAYQSATAPARSAYDSARASARSAYDSACDLAWSAYVSARASAWSAYQSARASALCDAFRTED